VRQNYKIRSAVGDKTGRSQPVERDCSGKAADQVWRVMILSFSRSNRKIFAFSQKQKANG